MDKRTLLINRKDCWVKSSSTSRLFNQKIESSKEFGSFRKYQGRFSERQSHPAVLWEDLLAGNRILLFSSRK